MWLVTWPLSVSALFSEVGWRALWATHKTRNPIIRKPCELLTIIGNTHHPICPPPLLLRGTLGNSLLTEGSQALLPVTAQNISCSRDLVITLWESLILFAFTWQEVQKLFLFSQKAEGDNPYLRQLCQCLMDQVGQELVWLSYCDVGAAPVPSCGVSWWGGTNCLKHGLLQIQGRPPALPEFLPFDVSYGAGSKFLKSEIKSVTFVCLQIPPTAPSVVGSKSKTEHLRYGETKGPPYQRIAC